MKIISYVGAESECIVITQPTDIYVLLDWCQSRMIDNQESAKGEVNIQKWQKAIDYLDSLMNKVEEDGFGSHEDLDKVEYWHENQANPNRPTRHVMRQKDQHVWASINPRQFGYCNATNSKHVDYHAAVR